MCKFCKNVDTMNDYCPIVTANVSLGLLGGLESSIVLQRKDGHPVIAINVIGSDLVLVDGTCAEISFCPICGRNLVGSTRRQKK